MEFLDYLPSEGTRLQIIQAAHQLFVRQGYHGTSMRQIAAEAGIALSGIYNHFSSKQEIFQAVFWEYHPYREVIPAVVDAGHLPFDDMLQVAAQTMLQALDHRPDFLNLILIEILEFKSEHIGVMFARLMPQIYPLLEGALKADARVRDIPFHMLLRSFVGLFISYYITEKLLMSPATPPEMRTNAMEVFVDIYLYGVLRREAGTASGAPAAGKETGR
jgi:AcrR family transcriptional regulator